MRDALKLTLSDGEAVDASPKGTVRGGGGEADFYRTWLRVLPDTYMSIDCAGRIVEWSTRAMELFGWSAGQVVGADACRWPIKLETVDINVLLRDQAEQTQGVSDV